MHGKVPGGEQLARARQNINARNWRPTVQRPSRWTLLTGGTLLVGGAVGYIAATRRKPEEISTRDWVTGWFRHRNADQATTDEVEGDSANFE